MDPKNKLGAMPVRPLRICPRPCGGEVLRGRDIPLEHFDIAFDHVSFGYDDRQVLHDVSFTIPEKTSTAIVGPSSSGKTTLCFAVQRAEISSEK